MSDYMIQKADDQIEAGINERDYLIYNIDKLKSDICFLEQKLRETDMFIMNKDIDIDILKKQLQHCKNQRDAWINSYTSIPEQIISRENKELEEIVK